MKKFFSILLVFSVVLLALLGALAVLPHAHPGDFNHSQHPACPVYQLALHAFDGLVLCWGLLCLVFVWTFFSTKKFLVLVSCFSSNISLRAPPLSV
jgi:hypothetical protein